MSFNLKYFIVCLLLMSCNTGHLKVVASLPLNLKETSAVEIVNGSDLFWVIQDAGNDNYIYGLNSKGDIVKRIELKGVPNEDYEDLTSDSEGNIYVGDFGNNNEKEKTFHIYKVRNPVSANNSVTPVSISFTLPDDIDYEDFESFFIYNNAFYIFSKSPKKTKLIKVPNQEGKHEAQLISTYKLDGKDTKVTSADISDDGKIVVLLNHDKLWKLDDFKNDDFFSGKVEAIDFEHDTQKEGITFLNDTTVMITDEQNGSSGGNIYTFDFSKN
ncbi:hypothetical protein AB9K26_14965 [Psychroserpens sp. XS_ASV72]|uniref:hypothetical protein n=1 Tax=Psychroserpens sp. XS_ASV72 TaxID=3241293 RepID=UPI003515F9FD